jgi:hypothetical protein
MIYVPTPRKQCAGKSDFLWWPAFTQLCAVASLTIAGCAQLPGATGTVQSTSTTAAQKASELDPPPYDQPAPYALDEFWSRFVVLLEMPKESMTREREEQVLRMRFSRASDGDPEREYHCVFADEGKDWYASMRFCTDKSNKTRTNFEIWSKAHKFSSESAKGPATFWTVIYPYLVARGWTRGRNSPHEGENPYIPFIHPTGQRFFYVHVIDSHPTAFSFSLPISVSTPKDNEK